MPPLVLTMVRHGESVDNLTSLWAGHRDAPLTNHGFNQSMRLAQHFQDVPITAIYTSDLKRAHTTALNVYEVNKASVKPPFTVSPLLREQFFGDAEGKPWDAGAFSSTHLPWDDHRAFRVADKAESLNEVGARADIALRHFIAPHLVVSAREPAEQQHVMIFAHGIFLSELMFAIKRAGDRQVRFVKTGGYTNTGWSRLELELADGHDSVQHGKSNLDGASVISQNVDVEDETTFESDKRSFASPPSPSAPPSAGSRPTREDAGLSAGSHRHFDLPPRHEALPLPLAPDDSLPTIVHKVIATNQTEHLTGLVRQKGGIGSAGHDDKQKKMKDFFGGGA